MKQGKIIIAPNAFKGALSAKEAVRAIKKGLLKSGFEGELIEIPIADGGDGSLEVIAKYLDLQIRQEKVTGPLGGEVESNWGYNSQKKLGVIELAEASGIRLLSKSELNPLLASTYGTGELIRIAISSGAKDIYLTVGGSATVDLGIGILEALGAKFSSKGKTMDKLRPKEFVFIDSIDLQPLLEIKTNVHLKILSDVTNPLLGEEGAAVIFGPQKGADAEMVNQLEQGLGHLAALLEEASGRSIRNLVGGGAAGGVTAGLNAALDAEIVDGAGKILNWAEFDKHLGNADLLITGEGKIDTQTNFGKGPGLVAKKAKERGIRVIGLSGMLDDDISSIRNFDQLIAISDPAEPLAKSIKNTAINLEKTASVIL